MLSMEQQCLHNVWRSYTHQHFPRFFSSTSSIHIRFYWFFLQTSSMVRQHQQCVYIMVYAVIFKSRHLYTFSLVHKFSQRHFHGWCCVKYNIQSIHVAGGWKKISNTHMLCVLVCTKHVTAGKKRRWEMEHHLLSIVWSGGRTKKKTTERKRKL